MKRLFTILLSLCVALNSFAQDTSSIVIEQNSFRPLQTDALTGVNIDPIGVDSSRRPCARIKVRINRMTKEDINEIEVRIVTNSELRKCKTAEYDNGLIIEMTAKPGTRFYFHHKRLGYSNEVTLNLEPNKEYRLDAYLNQQYPVNILTDVAGADIYVDDMFKGRTNSSNRLVVHDITPGKHILKVEYSGQTKEQIISVNSENLIFVQNMLSEGAAPSGDNSTMLSTSGKQYKVGDYYNENGKQGVVFEVDGSGCHGKIVSLNSKGAAWCLSKNERKIAVGAADEKDGKKNMDAVQKIEGWMVKFPAFAWCSSLGNEWYLPAKEELISIYKNKALLENKLAFKFDRWLWSSTEVEVKGKAQVWVVSMQNGDAQFGDKSVTLKGGAFGMATAMLGANISDMAMQICAVATF